MTTTHDQLFLVEDDAALREMLADYFVIHGLRVCAMGTAEALLDRLGQQRPDAVLLDVELPGMSGLQACQRMRARGDALPVILMTGRSDEIDRIIGLELGADDYLVKPFSARELLARTRALLRRARVADRQPPGADRVVAIGDQAFVIGSRSLVRGHEVRVLNPIEFALLAELTAHPGVPVSRERLMAVSHRPGERVLVRAVDAAIMRLRRLLEPDPARPRYIQTVRYQGYAFVPMVMRLHHGSGVMADMA